MKRMYKFRQSPMPAIPNIAMLSRCEDCARNRVHLSRGTVCATGGLRPTGGGPVTIKCKVCGR